MSFSSSKRAGVKAEINVTPLVDVTLVLLIIFIVVTPMLQRGRDVELPRSPSSEHAAAESAPLVLVLTAEKAIWIGDQHLPEEALHEQLARALIHDPARDVLLKADQSLSVGDVRHVMSLARAAGAKGVALAVRPSTK